MTPEQEIKLAWLQEMRSRLRAFLLTSEPVVSISVAGMAATFDRKGAFEELKELERMERDLLRPNRRVRNVDLRNAF